jgi:hypothetical protein
MAIDERFVYLDEAVPGVTWDAKYATSDNLTGQPLDGYKSCEIFGDALDRTVDFDLPLSELAGKPVCLEFTMREAELYAMRFE